MSPETILHFSSFSSSLWDRFFGDAKTTDWQGRMNEKREKENNDHYGCLPRRGIASIPSKLLLPLAGSLPLSEACSQRSFDQSGIYSSMLCRGPIQPQQPSPSFQHMNLGPFSLSCSRTSFTSKVARKTDDSQIFYHNVLTFLSQPLDHLYYCRQKSMIKNEKRR